MTATAVVAAEIIDTYRLGKDLPKAQKEAESALKKWPDDRTLHVTHASLLADMGQTDAAAAEMKKLLDGKSDREVYFELARLVYDRGRKFDEEAKALDAAEKLSVSKEEKQDIWFQRGAMFERMKKIDLAEAEFRKIIEINPDNAPALNYLGYMLADRNVKLPEALSADHQGARYRTEQRSVSGQPGLGLLQNEPACRRRKKICARRWLRTPRDATVHDHMGDVLLRESKVKEAIAQWQLSLQEFEKSLPADVEPADVAKVKSKLEGAKVRLAKESTPNK